MRFTIKSTGFELTPALQQELEKKFIGFDKYLKRWDKDGAALLEIEVAKTTNHHNKGQIFYAEANLQLPNIKLIRIE